MATLDQIHMSEKLRDLLKRKMQPFRLMQRATEKYLAQQRFAYEHSAKGVNRHDRRTAAAMYRRTRKLVDRAPEFAERWAGLHKAAESAPFLTPARRILDKRGAVAYISR